MGALLERPPRLDPVGWREIAEDLETLARLHDREPDAALIETLRQAPIAEWLALDLAGSDAAGMLDTALGMLPSPVDQATLDALAADYADIYLVHGLQAAPMESPWLDQDRLVCQEPMFEVREWFAHYGVAAADWRQRPDDHLVLQLRFMAHLARLATMSSIADLGRFMDLHCLRWVPDFAGRVAARCATPFFAGLAGLTDAYLAGLRDLAETATGVERRVPPPPATGESAPQQAAYLPGAGPGW